MDVIKNIETILESNPDEKQLDQYIADIRESLTSTNKQFFAYQFSLFFTLILYHLIIHEGWKGISIGSVQISGNSLFDKAFLIFPAGILIVISSLGYLRRLQREVYDYLTISRLQILGQTGVHELRLPSNYILGLDILRREGGFEGKIISYVNMYIVAFVFIIGPATYMLIESMLNIKQYGFFDPLALLTLVLVTLSFISIYMILKVTSRIKS